MIRRFIKYLFGFLVLVYISIDVYIYNCYKKERYIKSIVYYTRIYSSIPDDNIPDNIINAYEKVFPGTIEKRIYPDLIWAVLAPRHDNTYVQINYAYDISFASDLEMISVANQLDNRLTKKQCIYAYLCKMDFLNQATGLIKAAKIYYNKDVKSLSEKECIELVIMTRNPSIYNKFTRQDILDKEVKRVLSKKSD